MKLNLHWCAFGALKTLLGKRPSRRIILAEERERERERLREGAQIYA